MRDMGSSALPLWGILGFMAYGHMGASVAIIVYGIILIFVGK